MKEHEIPCELCGEVYDPDELIPFDDRLICPECLENETTLCACCGQRIWLTDNAGNDNTPTLPNLLRPKLHDLLRVRPPHPL